MTETARVIGAHRQEAQARVERESFAVELRQLLGLRALARDLARQALELVRGRVGEGVPPPGGVAFLRRARGGVEERPPRVPGVHPIAALMPTLWCVNAARSAKSVLRFAFADGERLGRACWQTMQPDAAGLPDLPRVPQTLRTHLERPRYSCCATQSIEKRTMSSEA